MFPAVNLESFEESTDITKLQDSSLTSIFQLFGFIYAIGLFRQMSSLHKLAMKIFIELEKDFDKLEERMQNISERSENMVKLSKEIIRENCKMTAEQFTNVPYSNNDIKEFPKSSDMILSNADMYVMDLIENSQPNQSLSKYESILPNWQELDKKISDPSQFERQYKEEMIKILSNLMKKHESKKKRTTKKTTNVVPEKLGITVLEAYIETIPPPKHILIAPPPVGQTKNWRSYSSYDDEVQQQNVVVHTNTLNLSPNISNIKLDNESIVVNTNQQNIKTQQIENNTTSIPSPPPPPPPPSETKAHSLYSNKVSNGNSQRPNPPAQLDHLALIRQGVKLRKMVPSDKKEKVDLPNNDPDSLSITEILEKVAAIRESVASDSSESDSDDSDSDSTW